MLLSAVLVAAIPLLATAAPAKDNGDTCHHPIHTTKTTNTTATSSTASSTAAPTNSPFSAISARSASPVHLLPLEAYNRNITLGLGPSSYCPKPANHCPPGTGTVFIVNHGAAALGNFLPFQQLPYPPYLAIHRSNISRSRSSSA
jgi:hypothetical protein